MSKEPRISRKIALFNPYINNTDTYLNAGPGPNWTRLGFSAAEANQWQLFKNQWNALYPLYSNKKESRTTAIKDQLRLVQRNFIAFAEPLLDRIAASPNTVTDDFEVFNIKKNSPMEDTEKTEILPPEYNPQPSVDIIRRLFHLLRFADPTNPHTQAMPKGCKIELQLFVGAANLPDTSLVFTTYAIKGRFLMEVRFALGDKGKMAYYRCRYVSNRGAVSPWSEVINAVIA